MIKDKQGRIYEATPLERTTAGANIIQLDCFKNEEDFKKDRIWRTYIWGPIFMEFSYKTGIYPTFIKRFSPRHRELAQLMVTSLRERYENPKRFWEN